MKQTIKCPRCGEKIKVYKNPIPTVDVILYNEKKEVLLIKRKNPPYGWAIPGGFVDIGESLEKAAQREIQEEVGLRISVKMVFGVYSSPNRDPRQHTITTVFACKLPVDQTPVAGDDAKEFRLFPLNNLPKMAFDHREILTDFLDRFDHLKQNTTTPGRSIFI